MRCCFGALSPERASGRHDPVPPSHCQGKPGQAEPEPRLSLQLEYCSTIWNPWQKTLSQKIESVQRSAARYVCNNYNYTSSVTSMLKALNWHTLEYRRNQSSLMYFYKIRNVLVHVDHHHLIPTRNLNYLIPHSNTQYHSNSYFPRTIPGTSLEFTSRHSAG